MVARQQMAFTSSAVRACGKTRAGPGALAFLFQTVSEHQFPETNLRCLPFSEALGSKPRDLENGFPVRLGTSQPQNAHKRLTNRYLLPTPSRVRSNTLGLRTRGFNHLLDRLYGSSRVSLVHHQTHVVRLLGDAVHSFRG